MLFTSLEFLSFFIIVFGMYWLIPKSFQNKWLLIMSYIFYLKWNVAYGLCLTFVTAITYIFAHVIEINKKKLAIIVGCGSCFFILAVFKYSSFLLENIAAILQIYLGIELKYSISWVVPVGISFYIFQATAYLLDVYYGRIRAERNLIDYALYVSFFPTVLSGPIERGTTLLPQINLQRMFDLDLFRKGGILVLWGAFLKLVLAERLAIYVNYVWDGIDECSGIFMIIAAIAYSLQIYCDFKSYSDIATGIALMLGFQLSLNFCQPYFAESISDFWRRWHISLSSWFRDYLYIPLGGGRCKRVKKYRNIMVVFLISGIWHGANWTFIFWGVLNGLLQIIEDYTFPIREKICKFLKIDCTVFSHRILKIACTFILSSICWIFFRADSVTDAVFFIRRMFIRWNPWIIFDGTLINCGLKAADWGIVMLALLILLIISIMREQKIDLIGNILRQGLWLRYLIYLTGMLAVFAWGVYGLGYDASSFIYFKF